MGKATKSPQKLINYSFPLPGKLDCSQPQTLKWESADDTPLGK